MNRAASLFMAFTMSVWITSRAEGGIEWQDVTADELSFVSGDDSPAVVLFEKVLVSDEDLERSNMYTDYYRRIKICTVDGVQWGDVTLDYWGSDEIKDIHGRTIQPNGEIVKLNEKSIQEGTVLKADNLRWKRKSFSMPACSPGSIIEYKYRVRRSEPVAVWQFQSDLPLQTGELRWKWCRYWTHTSLDIALQLIGERPSYAWINGAPAGRVVPLDGEVYFEVKNVPPVAREPLAPPLESLQGGLRCFYGLGQGSNEYWVRAAGVFSYFEKMYLKDNKAVKSIISERGWNAETGGDSAFAWIQENLSITAAKRADDIGKIRMSVNEVVTSQSGNQFDAVLTQVAFLRALGLEAQVIYARDCRNGKIDQNVEDWQFDTFLAREGHMSAAGRFYAPGYEAMEAGRIPWYVEGTEAMIHGEPLFRFGALPQSPPESNATETDIHIAMDGEAKGKGRTKIVFSGHRARELRLKLKDQSEANQIRTLSEMVQAEVLDAELDSLQVDGLAKRCGPVCVQANIILKKPAAPGVAPMSPFRLRRTPENVFKESFRIHPVSLGYSYSLSDVIEVEIPSGWKGNVLGSDSSFKNSLGIVKTESQLSEGKITTKRSFRLSSGYWPETLYGEGRDLLAALEETQSLTHMIGP